MWKLQHVKKDHVEHYLFVGEEFVVGRKDATLLIAHDPSLSRRHAVLCVKHPEGNLSDPSKKSSLFLRDEGSKYGTFKNGVRISSEIELQHNDLVKFGQFESEFRIHYLPLVITTSCLEVSAKKDLRKTVHLLGGSFISEWQPSCTHLVMTEVKVTVKALCCLVSAKPIVKPEYFQELKKSLKSSTAFLLPNKFIPPVGEALIDKDVVSFDINLQRKTLFKNKTFFFLDEKQFKKLHLGIILGGGNASILSKDQINPEILLREGSCVIEPMREMQQSQEMSSVLPSVRAILQKKENRLIPESDIGLSVAYCSTDKFCNPKFNLVEVLQSQKIQSQSLTQREVYVPDTQERSMRTGIRPRNQVSNAFSSLHLSSFQNDAVEEMEVSEVPVSAQIKQELDDIFDDLIESRPEIPSRLNTLPATLPATAPDKSPKQEVLNISDHDEDPVVEEIPKRHKRTSRRQNDSPLPDKIPKKEQQIIRQPQKGNISMPKISSGPKQNGVAETEVTHNINLNSPQEKKTHVSVKKIVPTQTNGFISDEAELPRNLAKVEFADLVCRKPVPVAQKYSNSTLKNFKKFKKVHPRKSQALPRIIGAHELVAYDKVAAEISNEVWDDPSEQEPSQPVKGEFDW